MFLILLILLSSLTYSLDQHQLYLYMGLGISQQRLDLRDNIYDTIGLGVGLGYRWNKFLSEESINYFSIGLGIGGGMIFPRSKEQQSLLNYNTSLDLDIFLGYGVGLGQNKQHQISILGISGLPKFYGLLERNNFTQIGGTEVKWYQGFYIPISLGIYLPSYRYTHNRFFIGFQHSINIIISGNKNINIPEENLILSSLGYQFKVEFGLNYDNFSKFRGNAKLEKTTVFIETNGQTILLSLFAKIEKEETRFVNIEIFALYGQVEEPRASNLIAYASKIPVSNGQAQFTKYWKENKNFFDERIQDNKDVIYVVIKELNKENQVLIVHDLYKYLVENSHEKK
ncbi:MAG: hypothetical protein ACRC0X_06935 [Brevinema sp.]